MKVTGEQAARKARALIGTRFRPQGRDPASGLDCIGLVAAAFEIAGGQIRRDYRLRGDHRGEIEAGLLRWFRKVGARSRRAGDVMLMRAGADQLHLAVISSGGFIHADARLGRVVETPGQPLWPVLAVFRRRQRGGED